MNFISNEVVDYISSSIHHVSSYDEIEYIKTVFYEKIPDKTSLLGHFAFQELMWYKCVNNKIMYVQNCNRGFNDFKECFKSPIYILGNDVFYLLHLFTLKNRDVIYLINNCFIHVSVYGILNVMDVNDDGEKTLLGGIKRCISLLGNTFTEYYIISLEPKLPNNANRSSFNTIIEKDYLVEHDVKPNDTYNLKYVSYSCNEENCLKVFNFAKEPKQLQNIK